MHLKDTKFSILVAEDEAPTRCLLQSYLSSFPQIDNITAVTNGLEAIENLASIDSKVVFLDVEMPGLDGLSTAAKLKAIKPDLFIVFVSAHTKYAADAFQLEAIDYLVKPITRVSIARTIEKIQNFFTFTAIGKPEEWLRLSVKNDHEISFIDIEDILFIEKKIRKSIIHTSKGIYPTSESLSSLENQLAKSFFRCHKSFIINLKKIEKIAPIAERLYKITFYDYPHFVTMGRQRMEELCSIMAR